jgi:gamma-butyrobetaine dioxygenase
MSSSSFSTPDFDIYPMHQVAELTVKPLGLEIQWADGMVSHHLSPNLREHAAEPHTSHPITRETMVEPQDIPAGFAITSAQLLDTGFVSVSFSHTLSADDTGTCLYHPGWLYQTGLSSDTDFGADVSPILWDAAIFDDIPKIDGSLVLDDSEEFHRFLLSLARYGVAVVRGLPPEPEIIETLPGKIGVIRTSNFGHIFDVETKPEADSNAYTSVELRAHTDLATREYMPGLQFLFCLQNDATGGHSTLSDGFAVAEFMRKQDPDMVRLLSTVSLDFANKAATSDYRMAVPLFHHDENGQLNEVRWTSWLRAPLRGTLAEMALVHEALRHAYLLGNNEPFKVSFKLEPGDMMCFDNRRVLHGRTSFDPTSGARRLRGCYVEREELWSALRIAARQKRASHHSPS